MYATLKVDVKSHSTRRSTKDGSVYYGRAGDKVTIIAEHGDVFIVEGAKERFSVNKLNLNF
jgi:hypothetical protein